MIDLNKMNLEQVEEYARNLELWFLKLFIGNEGYENAIRILRENERL